MRKCFVVLSNKIRSRTVSSGDAVDYKRVDIADTEIRYNGGHHWTGDGFTIVRCVIGSDLYKKLLDRVDFYDDTTENEYPFVSLPAGCSFAGIESGAGKNRYGVRKTK